MLRVGCRQADKQSNRPERNRNAITESLEPKRTLSQYTRGNDIRALTDMLRLCARAAATLPVGGRAPLSNIEEVIFELKRLIVAQGKLADAAQAGS